MISVLVTELATDPVDTKRMADEGVNNGKLLLAMKWVELTTVATVAIVSV